MSIDIRNVKDITSLITYFSENLAWDIDVDDFEDIEDITYDFEAEDIGLKQEAFAKISSLRQLPPLVDGQKWGVFFVEFESNKFEISALRKILSGLIPKRRNSAEHAVWNQQDLLFICAWGEGNNRTIGIAHFEDKESGLPQIKMISCAPAVEDFIQIKVFEDRLEKLSWPKNPDDVDDWRRQWTEAFLSGYRQNIQDSATLTIQLANEAKDIRDRILRIMNIESNNGYVHLLYEKFRTMLVHDMTEIQFADMYAQTVVYGLFSARCMDTTMEDFSSEEAIECIPLTNPFLKNLMKECFGVNSKKLLFDELEIGNVVELLQHTQMVEMIKDFNRQTGGGREDPVIHFYEEFLSAYDKAQKIKRGVYYTPQPVVTFIVKAVDELLKIEFDQKDGLASTEKRQIKVKRTSKKKGANGLYGTVYDNVEIPRVQILDPSTGTGTFLRQVIIQIYRDLRDNYPNLSRDEFIDIWNNYVPDNLLKRMFGFELMMAPYAVAHMKLAMVLKDSGYNFENDQRLQVFLTNTLEEAGNSSMQMTLWDDPLATESIEANKAKKDVGINVIVGNPPYSGESANKNPWIMNLMEDYKKEPGGIIKLQERNPKWINDDYVKFIRYAQSIIDRSGAGILAYICPHGFIDNPTFRGMRWNLMKSFNKIYVIDLHGNAKKKETCPDGSKDENVFDIQQGVCIVFGIKKNTFSFGQAEVYHTNLYGTRELKYDTLRRANFSNIKFKKCNPQAPQYFYVPKDFATGELYNSDEFFDVASLLTQNSVGFVSARDKLCIQNSETSMIEIVEEFSRMEQEAAREHFKLGKDVRDWQVRWAQDDINRFRDESGKLDYSLIQKVNYRPFDEKYTFYTGKSKGFQCYPRYEIMQNLFDEENIALCLNKVVKTGDSYQHCFISNRPIDSCYVSNKTSEITYAFPLYTSINGFKKANLDNVIIGEFEKRIEEKYSEQSAILNPMSILGYVYAILNSSNYKKKYIEFLKIGFPRIPFPKNIDEFEKISNLGCKLMRLQIDYENLDTSSLHKPNSCVVEKIEWNCGKIYLNKHEYFEANENEWNYMIGCYQILNKWLKDRKGMLLTENDINKYLHVISAVKLTLQLQEEISDSTNEV